jgi:hypothetical protein
MPRTPLTHANERIDKVDLDAIISFPRDLDNLLSKYRFQDKQSRIMQGFRVELPTQSQFPGRIVVHGGFSNARNGQHLHDEDNLNDSKTVTLEGSSTTFYVEIEFIETDSDVDARAFWDPTVDQGLDVSGDALPDGQEFSSTVATRKTPGWRVVTPISTTGFERDQPGTINSNKIPLVQLATDANNEITLAANTNLSTEKAVSTVLEAISTSQWRVQNPTLFVAGENIDITDATGTSATTITTVDYESGLVTTPVTTIRSAGAIMRVTSGTSPEFIVPQTDEDFGRYRRIEVAALAPGHVVDHRDMMFRGDEVHGHILSRGHGSVTDRSDVNLQSLKDQVDFLAAKLQEMQWGHTHPHEALDSTNRIPPGLTVAGLPAVPRYYDRPEGSLAGARTAAITVGDGTNSWGDLNGTTEAVLQVAHDALPASGGRIFLKRGTYTLSATDFDWTNTGVVTLEGEEGSIIEFTGAGKIHINTTGTPRLKSLTIRGDGVAARTGILVDTSNPTGFEMEDIAVTDCSLDLDALIPFTAEFRRIRFFASSVNMSLRPLVRAVGVNSVLSGVWTECSFVHDSFNNVVGTALIDLVTVTPTLSANLLSFVDCVFSTLTNFFVNLDGVSLGTTAAFTQFTRCIFSTLLTVVHVRIGGGSNIKFNECMGIDAIASLVQATGVDHIEVDAYVNSTGAILFPAVDLTDCTGIKVSNCDVITQSAGFGSTAGIKIIATSSDVDDVLIEGNSISGTTDNTIGVMLDLNGSNMRNVRINSNLLDQCACGIGLLGTSGVNDYEDVTIQGNQIVDGGIGDTATYLKLGIYGAAGADFKKVNIIGNHVQNCNTADVLILAVNTTRQGIIIKGPLDQAVISENQIMEIGEAANLMANASGIWLTKPQNVNVSKNVISSVAGITQVSGIQLGESPNWATRCTVSDNVIETIDADTGSAWGIRMYKVYNSTFTGNFVGSLTTSSGTLTAAFGVDDASNGQVSESTFTGNKFVTSDSTGRMFFFRLVRLQRVAITGNESSGGYLTGDETTGIYYCFMQVLIATALDHFEYCTISNNIAHRCTNGNVLITTTALGNTQWITITGNNFQSEGGHNIEVDAGTHISVSGNTLINHGASVNDRNVLFSIGGLTTGRILVDHNMCYEATAGGKNIELAAGADQYQVNHNLCDRATAAGNAIDTSAAGVNGVVYGNLNDTAGSYNVGAGGVTAGAVYEVTFP